MVHLVDRIGSPAMMQQKAHGSTALLTFGWDAKDESKPLWLGD
ncbi:hypothetical protein PbB2_02221 [Candidatus Phycosocius bacilliformis]|uniref:Uncharacterized protein n=1 Tax=Candidatus Phycosocius bacilliformis TaxID=1445552 RepID=A0A2P2EBT8_9PROT|nr:hypothetical protein PbB2_02221 [Candidatus Phycosocius bacilliformis]